MMFALPHNDFDAWPPADEDGRPSDDGAYLLSWVKEEHLATVSAATAAADAVSLVTSAGGGSKASLPAASPPPSPIGLETGVAPAAAVAITPDGDKMDGGLPAEVVAPPPAPVSPPTPSVRPALPTLSLPPAAAAAVSAVAATTTGGDGDAGLDLAADLRAYTMEGGEVAVAADAAPPVAADADVSVSSNSDASTGSCAAMMAAAAAATAVAAPPALQSIAPAGAPPPPPTRMGAALPVAASPGGGSASGATRKKAGSGVGAGGRRSPGGRRRLLSRDEMEPEVLARVARDGVRTLEELTHDDLRRYTRNQLRAYCRIYGECERERVSFYAPPCAPRLSAPLLCPSWFFRSYPRAMALVRRTDHICIPFGTRVFLRLFPFG